MAVEFNEVWRSCEPEKTLESEAPAEKVKILKERGEVRAKKGDYEVASTLFQQASTLDPTLKINAEIYAKELAAQFYYDEGRKFAKDGNRKEAIDNFKKAQKLNNQLNLDPISEWYQYRPKLKIYWNFIFETIKNISVKLRSSLFLQNYAVILIPVLSFSWIVLSFLIADKIFYFLKR
ncbi:tetratricopeptide repeat protein [Nostoc sp. FACHB-145]|uniref:tetratricopeptide repeat protein n=1 Tax=Nostoc sp. FACHB-145 TaxID=2692836 RepID=UPI001685BC79|nr:tetratricopeptide repeat protein [Nostoc sp. FACHB-145]MBD2467860.1 tetratricopeptide repeat protein [Nostoc sp. FACHB-145]